MTRISSGAVVLGVFFVVFVVSEASKNPDFNMKIQPFQKQLASSPKSRCRPAKSDFRHARVISKVNPGWRSDNLVIG